MLTVRDIMTSHVVFIDPDDTVEHAIDLMLRHGISGLPVVDSSGQLLGVITEFDVLDIVHDFFTEKNQVYHYMTRDIQTVDANTSATELADIFCQRSIRRYPVVDNNRLVGIISRRELIRLVHNVRTNNSHYAEPVLASL
ncbi:MAG: CBS domain-containing protein [Planctomycetales bacterium]|nr:CBS domain-containing protein [Planctomycetales bacterium]